MSFGAMAGWQALLLIAAAGAVAAWLFLIKIRPPRINVPSLLFWRRVLDQKRDETWWERIRRAVSLAATVLIAVALAMAVARPGPRAASTSRGKMLIVLDSSWSMLASTGSGTRWDRAVREARALAASANWPRKCASSASRCATCCRSSCSRRPSSGARWRVRP